MLTYHLIPENKNIDSNNTLKKINDYFVSFVGDINCVLKDHNLSISYIDTSYSAEFKIEKELIILETHEDDSVTINLLKNIASNSGFRIFNTKGYYLPNDSKLLDISSTGMKKEIWKIFKKASLSPIFQYRDSYIYFCLNKKKEVVLVNRHYLEFLISNPYSLIPKELSVIIAPDIATFIALFDRGLISLNFAKYQNNDTKVINLSGFDTKDIISNHLLQVTNFRLDKEKQQFIQEGTTDKIVSKNYLALKIGQDYSYRMTNQKLSKVFNISVFYGAD